MISGNQTWEEPIPISETKDDLPAFPVHCFPTAVGEYITALSENTQTSVDMAAVVALGILAVATQRYYRIEGNSGYYEPLNLYVLLVAEPGERKSSIMQSFTRFLNSYEEKNRVRLYADDCSSEALTTLLAENDGLMAVISTEGSIFDIIAGRYTGQKVNLDVWLKGHCGDEIRVDRKNRDAEYIHTPRLTTVLAVQPSVLEEVMENRVMNGRGLVARFLMAIPASRIGKRIFLSQAIPEDAVNSFQSVLESIFLSTSNKVIQTIRLSEEAKIIIENYFMENEKLLADRSNSMREWLAKNVGAVLRIAGILHLADGKKSKELLSGKTMQNATKIGKYFYSHAKYAYDVMDSGNTLKKAEYVLSKLKQSDKTQITRRELFRSCRGSYFKQVAEIKPILDMVEEYGYIRQETVAKTGTNRPSEMIYISPYLYGLKGQQGQ